MPGGEKTNRIIKSASRITHSTLDNHCGGPPGMGMRCWGATTHGGGGPGDLSGEATSEHTERGEGVSVPGTARPAGRRQRRVRVAAQSEPGGDGGRRWGQGQLPRNGSEGRTRISPAKRESVPGGAGVTAGGRKRQDHARGRVRGSGTPSARSGGEGGDDGPGGSCSRTTNVDLSFWVTRGHWSS